MATKNKALNNAKKTPGTYKIGECYAIVGIEAGMWHLSISHKYRYPNYDEIKTARYKLVPDNVRMAMIFPPEREFVNVHPNCFHLWQLRDEEQAPKI